MKQIIIFLALAVFIFTGCNNQKEIKTADNKTISVVTDSCCKPSGKQTSLSCKLSTPEYRKRQETVLASLKNQVADKKELPDGFAFKFSGSEKMIDELTEFVKTERHCCDFFNFNLSVTGDTSFVWLTITGPAEAKEFIKNEYGL